MVRHARLVSGCAVLLCFFTVARPAAAIPTFQVYADGGVGGDHGPDEDTWHFHGNSFSLFVVGAYGPNDVSLDNVTLVVSVREGETGTITITSASDGNPTLLTSVPLAAPLNPAANADADLLTDVAGNDGYLTKNFVPAGASFNEHYPFKDDVSDFLLFDLGSFDDDESPLNDYNAGTGVISSAGGSQGEQKEYQVTVTGFSEVHFDVYGLVTTSRGPQTVSNWDINPGSHDATGHFHAPVPGGLLLGAIGLGLVGIVRRRLNVCGTSQ